MHFFKYFCALLIRRQSPWVPGEGSRILAQARDSHTRAQAAWHEGERKAKPRNPRHLDTLEAGRYCELESSRL